MSFASARFLAFFAVLFVVYYLIPKRHQWKLLLVGSIFFYWFAGWYCLVYIGVTAVSTWLAGRKVGALFEAQEAFLKEHKADMDREARKAYKAREKARRFHWMLACLLLNFGILAVVKYTDFVIGNINAVASAMGRGEQLLSFAKLALPMGISFYTFQSMGYLIDVYRGKYPAERNLGKFALFVTFFPQLIQGPISRFDDLSKTLYAEHSWDSGQIAKGLERVIWGFFKKLVIADRLSIPLRTMLGDPGTYDGVYVLAIMFLYAIDLYADFTGGIDITIGVAQMLGIEVTENFNRPFFSKNTAEYWRRWHLVPGLHFLSPVCVQTHAEADPEGAGQTGGLWQTGDGVSGHYHFVVRHGTVARGQLELHRLGPLKRRGDHRFTGVRTAVRQIPRPVPRGEEKLRLPPVSGDPHLLADERHPGAGLLPGCAAYLPSGGDHFYGFSSQRTVERIVPRHGDRRKRLASGDRWRSDDACLQPAGPEKVRPRPAGRAQCEPCLGGVRGDGAGHSDLRRLRHRL